jgi:hypothetical protein
MRTASFSVTYTSPDLVEEVKIEVSPVDASASRGAGQVSMVTRSGTNSFRGSAIQTGFSPAFLYIVLIYTMRTGPRSKLADIN